MEKTVKHEEEKLNDSTPPEIDSSYEEDASPLFIPRTPTPPPLLPKPSLVNRRKRKMVRKKPKPKSWLEPGDGVQRKGNAKDRLLDDKMYLAKLARDLAPLSLNPDDPDAVDRVQVEMKSAIIETLDYLKGREQFWDQILVGNDSTLCSSFAGKAVESHRFLMK